MFHLRNARWVVLFLLCLGVFAESHEVLSINEGAATGNPVSWLGWIGRFHLLMLHFPIALIITTIVAEWLWIWFENPLFDHAARFIIVAAAIFAPPTALLGLALSYDQSYSGVALDLLTWHRYFGIVTACLVVVAAILRERYVRQYTLSLTSYYVCLVLLFLCINLTGVFGGSLSFGMNVG